MPGTLLRRCHYTEDVQHGFADLSGDYNPLHVDPIAARRTVVGGLAVHGIHLAITALEAVLSRPVSERRDLGVTGFTAEFLKPVLVGDVVRFYLTDVTDLDNRIVGKIGEEPVCTITVQFGPMSVRPSHELPLLVRESVAELQFESLRDKRGSLALGLELAKANQLFPFTVSTMGADRFAATLALSRLIGMCCPGLHSIFALANIRYPANTESGELTYQVEQTDERFGRVVLAIRGPGIQGQLLAFYRPPPEAQPDMAAVTKLVEPSIFANSIALIIGGSRGLGEVTGKIIAAGGGLPIITYFQGASDAQRVADDILSQGGRCETLQLDVRHCQQMVRRLRKKQSAPRTIYYFATPRIFGRRRGFFSHDTLQEFNEIYVTAFGRLLDAAAKTGSQKLRVFYPSSVAINEGMREMAEYGMAKNLGEQMCSFYNQYSRQIEIVVERLPRTMTDQTSTLLPFPAENALDVMLPIVKRIEKLELSQQSSQSHLDVSGDAIG
jgi:MaoC like domain